MSGGLPFTLRHEVVILCEGAADQNFLKALMAQRGGFPPVDFIPPSEGISGRTGFGPGLRALVGSGVPFARLKGVLCIADSHDDPLATFQFVCEQIEKAGFPVPGQPLEVAPNTPDRPSVAVMLLPDEATPGALESLLGGQIEAEHDWITECVDAFLQCKQIAAHGWPPEKRAKARFGALVAATCYNDPSRAATYAFSRAPTVADIGGAIFNGVEQRLREFFGTVGIQP
jgi:hypothetical protein